MGLRVVVCVVAFLGLGLGADALGQHPAGIGDPTVPVVQRPHDMAPGTGNLRFRYMPPGGYQAETGETCVAECNVIDFEGLLDNQAIGTIAGVPDVTFGPSWLSIIDIDAGGNGNFANEPSPSTIAYFLTPVDPITFAEGVGFVEVFYTAAAISTPVMLTAYDGPNGTGNVVALDVGPTIGTSHDGAPCSGDPNGQFCLWDALTLTSAANDIRSLVLSGAVANQFAFDNMTFCVTGDTDDDGLLDTWENCGIDADMDGMIDLDLPAMGADPNVKDIFVEVDAMVGRAPHGQALAQVQTAFQAQGIRLHSMVDETDIPLAAWVTGFPEFDAVKSARLGTPAERASPNWAAIRHARLLSSRYCIFADQYGGGGSSGLAEIGGDDFMVTLGHPSWNVPGGTVDEQAGTYMHELGHTLGLRHGGGDDLQFKPNYRSVMNYTWQFPTEANATFWSLAYSTQAYPALDELMLAEPDGIGGVLGLQVPVGPPPFRLVEETGPVDWNRDGDGADIGVQEDVNQIYESVDPTPGELLSGFHDWLALDLNFRDTPNFGPGVHIFTSLSTEMTGEEYAAVKDLEPSGRWLVGLRQAARGRIESELDSDSLWFHVPADSALSVIARRKKGLLSPAISVVAPDGVELVTEAESVASAKMAKVTTHIAEAGLYRVTLVGLESGNAGDYLAKATAKYPKKTSDVIAVPSDGVVFDLPGMVPGMSIASLRVLALPAKGEHSEVEGEPAALLPEIELHDPAGDVIDLTAFVQTSKNGKRVVVKNLPIHEVGVHRLVVRGAGASVGWARIVLVSKLAKTKGVAFEPAQGDL